MKTGHDLIVPHISELFSEHWEREIRETEFTNGEKPGKFKDDGVNLLKAYFDQVAPGIQPVEVEREFLIDVPGVSRQQKWHRLRDLVRREVQVFSCMQENT